MAQPRKHHYVPRFYLANFSSLERKKQRIWVYEKGRKPRKSTPSLEGCRKDFYAFEENGQKNTEVETWFSNLEGAVAPLIADLVSTKREPTPNERLRLSIFMGTLYTRTPLGRQLDEDIFAPAVAKQIKSVAHDAEAYYKLYAEFNPQSDSRELAEQARQEVLSGRSDELEVSDHFRLSSMIHVGIGYGEVLSAMNWQFIYSPEDQHFITSDNPVTCEVSDADDPRAVHPRSGPNLPNALAMFPLTSRVCLTMHRGLQPGVGTAPAATVRIINKRLMSCAAKYIYASEFSVGLRDAFEKHGCLVPLEKLDLSYEGRKL